MAYASVASLLRTIQLLLTSNSRKQALLYDHRKNILTLREKVSSLEVILKKFEKNNDSGKMTDLEAQIQEIANVAEYTIQLRITEVVMANDEMQKEKAHERLSQCLQQVAEDIDRVQKESKRFQDKGKQASKESLVQDSSSAKVFLNVNNDMVGRNNERERLLTELTRRSSGELKVIPIVGMGGIGKTTLAEDVFNDVRTQSRFDVRAWATISKQHNVKDILISLLRSTKEKDDTVYPEDESELAAMLKKSLNSRRYLIVLDDMWSSEAWNDVRHCFPSQNNESRILLTTRITEVACHASTENLSLSMDLMGPVESWNLFKRVAFANEALPTEFENIGKQIVDKCHGLPLTVVVVAGLLSKSKRTIEDWESVAKDVKSFVTNDPDKQCLHVLALSYNNLTSDLKACLLYFGIFPEDSEISVKRLVRLWMAEGFLKLEKDLEGEAEKSLQDLVDRCLVLVIKKSWDGTNIRSCKVHDLIYELCLREVQSRNIFIMKDIVFDDSDAEKAQSHDIASVDEPNPVASECHHLSRLKMQFIKQLTNDEIGVLGPGCCRAILTPGHNHLTDDDTNSLLNRTRSIICARLFSQVFPIKYELIHFDFLRILDLKSIWFDFFPPQILNLIWLRYLALSGRSDIPPDICRLWDLQTFYVDVLYEKVPEQIWELKQLRHLKGEAMYLPNPPSSSVDEERYSYFPNVQTIRSLSPECCTEEVMSGIRNVKNLVIDGDNDFHERVQESRLSENLVHLHQLEKLSIILSRAFQSRYHYVPLTIPSAKAFPPTLKKLKLWGTRLSWEELNIIGELPNLEVLKLRGCACVGETWYLVAGGFTRLKFLLVEGNDFIYWKATNDTFPVLERLVIQYCTELEEIPIEFAEIDSLRLIQLKQCTAELEASAARIQQEQEDLGNNPVDVCILPPLYLTSDLNNSTGDEDDDDNDRDDDDDDEQTLVTLC